MDSLDEIVQPEEHDERRLPTAHEAVGYLADLVSAGALESVTTVVGARSGSVEITIRQA